MDLHVDESELKDMITEAGEVYLYNDAQEELIDLQNGIHDENVKPCFKGNKNDNFEDSGGYRKHNDYLGEEEEEEDNGDDNCLVIDEDCDSEGERCLFETILHKTEMHSLINGSRNLNKGMPSDSSTSHIGEVSRRKYLFHGHDYCFNAEVNRLKADNNVSISSKHKRNLQRNKNVVVVMQNNCVESWDLQQSLLTRRYEDLCNVEVPQSHKLFDNQIDAAKQLKVVGEKTHGEKTVFNKESSGKLSDYVNSFQGNKNNHVKSMTKESSNCSKNVIYAYLGGHKNIIQVPSGINVDIDKDKTKVSLPASSLKQNMESEGHNLENSTRSSTPKVDSTQYLKARETGESKVKDIAGKTQSKNEVKTTKSVLDRRKIRCKKINVFSKGSKLDTSPRVELDDIFKSSKSGNGPFSNSTKISSNTKKMESLLKKQNFNSSHVRKELVITSTAVRQPESVEPSTAKEISKDNNDSLGIDKIHGEMSEIIRESYEDLVTENISVCDTADSEAETENPFDGYIIGSSGRNFASGPNDSKETIEEQGTGIEIDVDDESPVTGIADPEAYTVEVKVLECQECCSVYDKVVDFDKHLRSCKADAKKSKICGVCRVAFPDSRTLYAHECKRDKDSVQYTCYLCRKKYMKRDIIFAHMKIHSKSRDFICEICNKSFLHKHHLVCHMDTHRDFRAYKCQVCTAAFKRMSHLQKHHKLIHEPKTEGKFKCRYCDLKFYDNYRRTRHEKVHSSAPKNFTCKICNGMFWENYTLKKHMAKVHFNDLNGNKKSTRKKRQFRCEVCGAVYYWKKHLDTHMKSHAEPDGDDVIDCNDEKVDENLVDMSDDSDSEEYNDSFEMVRDTPYGTRANSKKSEITK